MLKNISRSIFISLITITSLGAILLQPAASQQSSPQQSRSKSFVQWCQESRSGSIPNAETNKTVSILLTHVKTIDCKQASSRLKMLTFLNLGGKQLRDIQVLASLNHLTSLDLSHNELRDLKPLASLTRLNKLFLGFNQIADISPLVNLSSLTSLALSANKIADIKHLVNLKKLKWLTLNSNQISNISLLSKLTNITFLQVSDNPIDYEVCPLKPKSICVWVYN
jgi:Leucine-rich repeat (LRR) protein